MFRAPYGFTLITYFLVDQFEVYEEAIGTKTSRRPPSERSWPLRAFWPPGRSVFLSVMVEGLGL